MRLKEIHIFNMPSIASTIFKIAISAMGQKVKDRVKFYENPQEFLDNYEDRDILPEEYGGKVPFKEMIADFKVNLRNNQEKLLAMDDQYIEDDLEQNKSKCGDEESFAGSFRKLEVD